MPVLVERVREKAEEIIYNRLGTNIAPGEPEFFAGNKLWVVPLELDLPRVIDDKRTGNLSYVVFRLGKIGALKIDDRFLKPVETPKRTDLNQAVEEKLVNIHNKVESLLVQTASLQFARLVSLKHMMSPLETLVTKVLKRDSIPLPDKHSAMWRSVFNYVELLVKRELLVREGDEVKPAGLLQEIHQTVEGDINKTLELVLKEVIEKEYETVYHDYKIKILHPYVQISSAYYDYALSAHELIALSEEDLWDAYSNLYGGFSKKRWFKFDNYLRELSDDKVKLLNQVETGIWEGDRDVLEKLESTYENFGGLTS
jgi:hypothetical protein